MLAFKSKLKLTLMLVGTLTMLGGSALGQQTPSQRYQPAPSNAIHTPPPAAHTPPSQMQKLPPKFRTAKSAYQVAPSGNQPSYGGAQYNFSDQTRQRAGELTRATRPGFEQRKQTHAYQQRGMVQQTSYQVDENGVPIVPEILAGGNTPAQPLQQFQPPSKKSGPMVDEMPRKTPADFAAAMGQMRSNTPRIAPGELASQTQDINAQMVELRKRAEEKAAAEARAAAAKAKELADLAAAEQQEIERLEAEKQEAIRVAALKVANAKAEADRKAEAMRAQAAKDAADRAAAEQAAAELAAAEAAKAKEMAKEISASEFINQITPTTPASTETAPATSPVQDNNTSPRLVAKQGSKVQSVPAVMQLANDSFSTPVRDDKVVQVSSQQEQAAPSKASIRLAAPAIQVESFGPQTVGVNKPANYKVVVKNNSNEMAERVLVGINMPQWIDIENVNLTTGGKEITDGKDQARLVWSIDKIPGNSSQTITITAVPRKAEVFDVGVEWTLVPRVGTTNINVTEPKLEMNIAGPQEVLYGETAIYHVTVRNPGTGTAETVMVMLPEALGGERAELGNIDAGKEKNFQVELLARTAGDLTLITTAVAEGNLKTSSERALTVRRANLNISLDGPGLKYAGSVATYSVKVSNTGDATANEIVSAVALPTGVKYISGVDSVKLIEGGMRWPVGTLEPGQTREFKINCQLDTSGDLQLEVGARGRGDLAASSACLTTVETVADLVLSVADPKGPLPTGESVGYTIKVQNRGSKSAKDVNLVMQFSEGIEPKEAAGLEHKISPGEVKFVPIGQIDPGQEMSFKVTAEAFKAGTHVFRAQLVCEESDAREVAEGTTRFFGETVQPVTTANASNSNSDFGSNDFGTEFKR